MTSVTRRTMSAFSGCAEPIELTIAAVTSACVRNDAFARRNTATTRSAAVASCGGFASSGELAEVQPRLAFVDAFANSAAVDTEDGLVVVDTSGVFHAKTVHETIRTWSSSRLDTAIFTHGHIDHVFGVDLYEEEAQRN